MNNENNDNKPKYNVLVVDKDNNQIRLIEANLKGIDAKIFGANNAKDAIDIVSNNTINLVFAEIKLPQRSGYDLVKDIKELNRNIPVIAQTAQIYDNNEEKCLAAGFDAYLSKPINSILLKNVCAMYLK